ncbi:hypothetical protein D3C72_707900 [compost metagenome]
MKKTLLTLIVFVAVVSFIACSKKEENRVEEGSYSGDFKVSYGSTVHTGKTSLTIEGNRFSSTTGANRFPAGGSGSCTINLGKMAFADQNYWTADFDWGLILSGEYEYSFDGKNLNLKKEVKYDGGSTIYEYKLKKN